MVKSTKTQRLREKVKADVARSKQTTFDSLPESSKTEPIQPATEKKKRIEITEIRTSLREDELVLKVAFKLFPSRTSFSRLTYDLYFDEQKFDSRELHIVHGPLSMDESEFSSTIDMIGIQAGQHVIGVEMYECWASVEKFNISSKKTSFEYVPQSRESKWVRIPTVKSVAGQDLTFVSGKEKEVYREIDKAMREEENSKKDAW